MNKRLIILLIILFSLTGCIKNNCNMKLETNNSFKITVINGMINTGSETDNDSDIFEKQKYIDNGYKVEDYDGDGYTGIKIIAEVDSIDLVSDPNIDEVELTKVIDGKVEDIKLFKKERLEDGTRYTANFTYYLSNDSFDQALSGYNVDISSYSDMIELEYSITLPYKLETNNATEVEGNTYSWDLKFGEVNTIQYSFIIYDKDITDDKVEYDDSKTENKEQVDYNISAADIIKTVISLGILVVVIVAFYKFKKKLLSRSFRKKKNGYHTSAPDSIKSREK